MRQFKKSHAMIDGDSFELRHHIPIGLQHVEKGDLASPRARARASAVKVNRKALRRGREINEVIQTDCKLTMPVVA